MVSKPPLFFMDNGYSGTSFERPSLLELIEKIEAGEVFNLIKRYVAAWARLSGSRLLYRSPVHGKTCGLLLSTTTLRAQTNRIATSPRFSISSTRGTPKIPAREFARWWSLKAKPGNISATPHRYGCRKDSEIKKQWVIAPEAAEVVKRIFVLCLHEYRPWQIARVLKEDKVLIPTAYWRAKGRTVNHSIPENPYLWISAMAVDILEKKDCLGHTVNFKTYRQSCKSKKEAVESRRKQLVFENTHGAIIDVDTWKRVQELWKSKRARREQEKQICFPALCAASTAGKSCITAQAGILKQGKTTLFVPLQD